MLDATVTLTNTDVDALVNGDEITIWIGGNVITLQSRPDAETRSYRIHATDNR